MVLGIKVPPLHKRAILFLYGIIFDVIIDAFHLNVAPSYKTELW